MRRHIYVYTFLVLYTLLVHTVRSFDTSPETLEPPISNEVSRLIGAGAVAKNLY